MAHTLDTLGRLRLWWLARQGLISKTEPDSIQACVRRMGWLATSSTGIYLSIGARMPGVSREEIDTSITTRPNPHTIRAEAKRADGSLAGEGTYVVAADGATMIASTKGFDSQLRPFTMKTVWDRT